MSSPKFIAALLHNVVRSMILELGFEPSYRILALQHFHLHENPDRRGFERLSAKDMRQVADWLYRLDAEERVVASCYSVSLTLQLMAYAQGDNPEMVIGLKKADEKLLGHAWLKLRSGEVINPGNESLENMAVMRRLVMVDVVNQWAMAACRSG